MKKYSIITFLIIGIVLPVISIAQQKNVLFLMADDFNYWAKCINYYEEAKTPNIDALASKGVLFTEAHCSSPVCNPSRNALWSGLRPSTTGISTNNGGYVRDKAGLENIVSMHQYFMNNGYYTYAGGKIWHPGTMGSHETDPTHWDKLNTGKTGCNGGSLYKFQLTTKTNYSWSANENEMTEDNCSDYRLANEVADVITNYNKEEPFFIACGFFRPHMPWNSPKQFWDLFNIDELTKPQGYSESQAPGNDIHQEIVNNNKWMEAIQAYLASMALADNNVGIVMNALNASDFKENTIVVFCGDHGWNLGEKGRWGKFSIDDQANHTTLIIYDPSAEGNGKKCTHVVSLQDLYPTLVNLCSLDEKWDVEGRDISPLLKNPESSEWSHPILMTYSGKNYIKSDKWKYLDDGNNSELYDNIADPFHWNNLYGQSEYNNTLAILKKQIDSMIAIGTVIKDSIIHGYTPIKQDSLKSAPGKIQIEHFDKGGPNVGYYDSDEQNKGNAYRITEGVDIENCDEGFYNIGWTTDGEWLKYTLDTVKPGSYDIHFRIAAKNNNNSKIVLWQNDSIIGSVDIPVTGDYQNWDNVTLRNIQLNEGYKVPFKVEIINGDFNLNYFEFELLPTLVNEAPKSKGFHLVNKLVNNNILHFDLTYSNPVARLSVYNINGKKLQEAFVAGEQLCSVELQSGLKNGMYVVVIDDHEQRCSFKFLLDK